jgi:eukaryotic-like serine/threonine-protein kinase
MNKCGITDDLPTLINLLDQALDLQPDSIDGWLAGLSEEQRHLAPRLREMLGQHLSGALVDFLSTCPKSDEGADKPFAHPGETVGPYRLLREIGRGGMSAVWLAESTEPVRTEPFAVKLPRLVRGVDMAERMVREGHITAMMKHPNVVQLRDTGIDAKHRPYLVLEYIAGQPLDAWCASKQLGVADRLRLFLQVARAVGYAHCQGVIHRDIKPANVLVTPDGQAHLLDFGIAVRMDDGPLERPTTDSPRSLTPGYASPEQLRGAATAATSDVYSLGIVLFELLTGRLPHRRNRMTLAAKFDEGLDVEPPIASSMASDPATAEQLRGHLDAIVLKALQHHPARRYATVDAFAREIEGHLAPLGLCRVNDRAISAVPA